MNKVYRLVTINDLLIIPVGSLEECLRDIQYAVELHRLNFGKDMPPIEQIDWTDDGNRSVGIYDSNGNIFVRLDVTDSELDE